MNRVINCGHDGISIEASQGHVREILKDLDLERGNHTATPCTVERKTEDNARIDESNRENQCEQGQCQTKHDWDTAGDGDDKNRMQMTNDARDVVNDCQALTSGGITKYRALEARISYSLQDRPDLRFSSMQVWCAMANPSASDLERSKRIGRYLVGKPRAVCFFHWQHGSAFGRQWGM